MYIILGSKVKKQDKYLTKNLLEHNLFFSNEIFLKYAVLDNKKDVIKLKNVNLVIQDIY